MCLQIIDRGIQTKRFRGTSVHNKIKNANIAEKLEINDDQSVKKSFYEKHPVICGFLISLVAGIVLLFSFWDRIVNLIEGVF